MIKFKDKKFKDYVDFQLHLILHEAFIREDWFPHSTEFYIRRAIFDNTDIWLSIAKIKQLIKEELALKTITKDFIEASQSNYVSC